MRVSLAAQVMSESVATVMSNFGNPEASGTANFIQMVDKFFDCLNVRHPKEGERKLKDSLKPYRTINDPRFEWFSELLDFFEKWKESIKHRPGDFFGW